MWKNKKVLVTGSEGLIGKELVIQLKKLGAIARTADLKQGHDFRIYKQCLLSCGGADYVFHLAGIKGSPKRTSEKPVDFMGPMLQFDTNMIIAANTMGIKRFLYTSSIAVENMETDFYPAWAKMTAEHLTKAMHIQYPEGTKYCVVRPANVYGRFDNFDNPNSMVVTSLVRKALTEDKLEVWGDGTQVRDFINAKDVARGMIKAMEEMPGEPVNLCSGEGITIKYLSELIAKETGKEIEFDPTKPRGADSRVMKLNWEFKPEIDIETGIKEVINEATHWYSSTQR